MLSKGLITGERCFVSCKYQNKVMSVLSAAADHFPLSSIIIMLHNYYAYYNYYNICYVQDFHRKIIIAGHI